MSKQQNYSGAADTCAQIRSLYTELALHPDQDFGWGKGKGERPVAGLRRGVA